MAVTIPREDVATYPAQSAPDTTHFDAIVAGHARTGVRSGCGVTASGSDLVLTVAAGTVEVAGVEVAVSGGTVTATADGTDPRRSLVYVDNTGTLGIAHGTPLASGDPAIPAIPANSVTLAVVYVPAGATTLSASNLTDCRVMLSTPSSGSGKLTADYLIINNAGTYEAYDRDGTLVSSNSNFVTVFNAVKASNRHIVLGAGDFDMGTANVTFNTLQDIIIEGQGMGITHVFNSSDAASDTEPWSYTNCTGMTVRDMDVSAGGQARTSSDAIDFDGGEDMLIERVRILDSRGRGIVLDGKDTGRTCDGNVIRNCVVTGCRGGTTQAGSGILMLGAQNNLVTGCRVYGNTGYGIAMQKGSAAAGQANKKSSGNRIVDNWVTENGISGVNIHSSDSNVIIGNVISNNSDDLSSRDGVEFTFADSITAENNIIANNRIFDDQGTATQDYGVQLGGADAIGTVITGNAFSGNVTGAINDIGTGTVKWANRGAGSVPTASGVSFVIDGGGSAITAGIKGTVRVPFACEVIGWEIYADQSGSIVVDVDRATYANLPTFASIAGTEKPTLSSAQKNQDLALSTWTTTLAEGDWLRFEAEATPATVTRVTVALILRRV